MSDHFWNPNDGNNAYRGILPLPPVNVPALKTATDVTASSSVIDETLSSDEEDHKEDLVLDCLLDLPRKDLISLLLFSARHNAGVRREIRRQAELNLAKCKIIVHKLPSRTTSQELQTFFSQFGVIKDCNVVTDRTSGQSKGYGFVNFLDPDSATRALIFPQKHIRHGVVSFCELFVPQQHNRGYKHVIKNPRMIYVASICVPAADGFKQRLYELFSKYGEIKEGPEIGAVKSGDSCYAIFVYETEEGARRALEEPTKHFDGYTLKCELANIQDLELPPGFENM